MLNRHHLSLFGVLHAWRVVIFCVLRLFVLFLSLFVYWGGKKKLIGWGRWAPSWTLISLTFALGEQDIHGFTPPPFNVWLFVVSIMLIAIVRLFGILNASLPPHFGAWLFIFSSKCLFSVVMCVVFLFPLCFCLFAKVEGRSSSRSAIAQFSSSSISSE